ncbi:hypothetical protein FH972_022116 [Carpinus fangiana]|uniref:Deacetylase sirtuin-type domain-containing protein n=1 Tax=Carpinus fangiana TaxID=176857 RepID=A0A5N6KTH7_9ROSI|nr:hypothetical protein FH972_022116 [Carpinus fangiana]
MSSPMSIHAILNPVEPMVEPSCPSSPSSSVPSSPLTVFSRSPSPAMPRQQAKQCPTPPASQLSGSATPRSWDESTCSSSNERDERPAKKRRTDDKMPGDTKYLNLSRLPFDTSDEQQPQLDQLLKGLRKKRRIVVVAGAGISVSAGIPDFRSATGIFRTIKEEYNLKGSGKDLFDASVYRDDDTTSTFHHMVRQMSTMVKDAQPTPFHDLVARLAHEGRLLRLYTQNIDGLDTSLEPLKTQIPLPKKGPWPKCIQLHGGLEKMQCSKCGELADFDASKFDGPKPPACGACMAMDHARTELAGKRSHGIGRMRPRMVLYSENSPDEDAIGAVSVADLKARPDAIIVVGTSMKIPGVRRIVKQMCALVRDRKDSLAVWINNEPEPSGKDFSWDIVVKGTSDQVADLAKLGKWDDPEIMIETATDEQMEAQSSSQPMVMLESPLKSLHLPTPLNSPRMSQLKLELDDKSKKLKNPASKGTNIHTILQGSKKTSAKSQKAKGPKGPTTKAAPRPRNAPVPTKTGIKISFKTTKTNPAVEVKAEKDLAPSTPRKSKQNPMAEVRPNSPKNNTNTPLRVRFPNLSPQKTFAANLP